jgi:hypothetical protein
MSNILKTLSDLEEVKETPKIIGILDKIVLNYRHNGRMHVSSRPLLTQITTSICKHAGRSYSRFSATRVTIHTFFTWYHGVYHDCAM